MKFSLLLLFMPILLVGVERHSAMPEIDLAKLAVFGPDVGGKINALKRNCVLLRKSDVDAKSWIGGSPMADADFKWPSNKDKAMSFVGQFDLGELNGDGYVADLPRNGALLAFYDADQNGWGFDPKETEYFKLLYVKSTSVNAVPLVALGKDSVFKKRVVAGIRTKDWATVDVLLNHGISLTEDQLRIYLGLTEKISEINNGFKLGGNPNEIQGDMTLECQLVTNGLYCGDSTGYNDPRRKALEAGSKDWNLILQIDSCDEIGMMWGDGGMLYYWIKDADRMKLSWDKTWLISQCY